MIGRRIATWPVWLSLGLGLGAAGAAGLHFPDYYEAEIRQFEAADQATPPPNRPILFTGSSSIRIWSNLTNDFSDLPVLNRGFGGSFYRDLAYYYERVLRRYQPAAVILYAGDNDLAGGLNSTNVFADCTNLVTRILGDLPECQVGIVSVKPSPARFGYLGEQRTFNASVRQFCEGNPRLHFIDVFSAMLDGQGRPRPHLYGEDRIHMGRAGYRLWRRLIRAELARWGPYPLKATNRLPALVGTGLLVLTLGFAWSRRRRTAAVSSAS